jgi:putative flippase GtrA
VKASLRYAATGSLTLGAIILVLWWFLDPEGRRGLLLAAAIALPVQVLAFALLVRFRTRFSRFLVVWVGGTLVRMALVVAVAVVALRTHMAGAVAMLLALAGFLFLLLLLEPLHFRLELAENLEAR